MKLKYVMLYLKIPAGEPAGIILTLKTTNINYVDTI